MNRVSTTALCRTLQRRFRCACFLTLAALTPLPQPWLGAAEGTPPPGSREEDLKARIEAAMQVLDTSDDTDQLTGAMEFLRAKFKEARTALVEQITHGSYRVKCFALQVLGEQGNAKEDLAVAVAALADPKPKVRLLAVMAVRKFGPEGRADIERDLPGETDPNNRKMAVKTLHVWKSEESIPLLIKLLKQETKKTVRGFIVTALEEMTGRRLGDNPEAWDTYIEGKRLSDQAKDLQKVRAEAAAEVKESK